ncbi:MAG: D-alanine--D-alanine ligase [Firmicutes bacterium]|nr:D-alanine--D-alanine ligase [Bacillota bacterium]
MSKLRLGIIFGGQSSEHEVSRVSAGNVLAAIDKEKYEPVMIGITKDSGAWLLYEGPAEALADGSWQKKAEEDLARDPEKYGFALIGNTGRQLKDMIDFALPILHGRNGEDGTVQGLFELIGLPYGGCSVAPSALAMDKTLAKEAFQGAGIAQTPYIAFRATEIGEDIEDRINKELKYPIFIKPVNMGSSVGISKVKKPEDLHAAIEFAAQYDSKLLAEQGVDCRELEVAVMGYRYGTAYEVGEIQVGAEFYDYNDKYKDGVSQQLVPAPISPALREKVMHLAEEGYDALGCDGYARVDFLLDRKTGDVLLNEINTIPGFTSISMFPMLVQSTGIEYGRIVDMIVRMGLERHSYQKKLD